MMQVFNPYLPLDEYVPDGEPHVFDGRLYIYGSHDRANGEKYCEDDYVTWSAPVDNLKDWRFEGIIYRKEQDPSNADGQLQLWAPDVTQGPDGRYYLYYCLSFYPEIGVAVSDSPSGPFAFYAHVKYPPSIRSGKTLNEHMPFDPAVLCDDDGRVYLYYGFSRKRDVFLLSDPDDPSLADADAGTKKMMEQVRNMVLSDGAMAVELEPDMCTVKANPHLLIPGRLLADGTGFEDHAFFEASSIRKVGSRYYFVYSSELSHELCYATSDSPLSGFTYGGTVVSIGDIGLSGRGKPVYTLGNTHGGIVEANGQWYVFYHHPTNGTEFSRQGCAEPITFRPDGHIDQVATTSCGLNGGPLLAQGTYPSAIACHLTSPDTRDTIDYHDPVMKAQAMVVNHDGTIYIDQIKNGSIAGYKYFALAGGDVITLRLKGRGSAQVVLSLDEDGTRLIGKGSLTLTDTWQPLSIATNAPSGVAALYFTFWGEDLCCAFQDFQFDGPPA